MLRNSSASTKRADVLVAAYSRLRRHAKTVNELNKIHIQLENRMTPHEREVLSRSIRKFLLLSAGTAVVASIGKSLGHADDLKELLGRKTVLIEGSRAWLIRLKKTSMGAPGARKEIWSRQRISRDLVLFLRSDFSSKLLVISFVGRRKRMGVALPDYLQACAAVQGDVLLVTATERATFGPAPPESGAIEGEGIRDLKKIVTSGGYERVVVVGTSAGGASAILAGLSLNANRTVALGPGAGGIAPRDRPLSSPETGSEIETGQSSPVTIFVGENAPEKDFDSAAFWRGTIGAQILIVPQAGHSPMAELIRTGAFPRIIL